MKLIGQKSMNLVVSHLDGVHDALGDTAKQVRRSGQSRLEQHRYEGDAKVTITEGDVDWFVNLDDPAALSIEFGHMSKKKNGANGHYVPGLYIITKAAGMAG